MAAPHHRQHPPPPRLPRPPRPARPVAPADRHGPLMFLKLGEVPVVVASTLDAAKEFMKTHDAIFATRPMTLSAKVFAKDGPGIVVAPYGGDQLAAAPQDLHHGAAQRQARPVVRGRARGGGGPAGWSKPSSRLRPRRRRRRRRQWHHSSTSPSLPPCVSINLLLSSLQNL